MNRRVSHLIAGWRTGLPRPVLILQAGNALNYFGYGLVLPFEIIYLHQIRGFSTSIAGLVLAATMGTAAIAAPPTGGLLDRYSAKATLVAGLLASALGYAGFAYVDSPWQAFACSIVSGAGIGAANTANRTLTVRLIKREQRTAAFALNRVSGNFGIGSGATVAGFIVAFAQQLSSFQTLYIFDAVTYAAFALIVLAAVPSPRAETVTATDANGTGFRAVARDRLFLTVIGANIVLVVVGHTFFSNILPPSARPLPVSLQSYLHHLPGPRPGDWWPSPADLARRHLVGWRACRAAGRSHPASTRQPHSRPAPRSTVRPWVGARGRVRILRRITAGDAFVDQDETVEERKKAR